MDRKETLEGIVRTAEQQTDKVLSIIEGGDFIDASTTIEGIQAIADLLNVRITALEMQVALGLNTEDDDYEDDDA